MDYICSINKKINISFIYILLLLQIGSSIPFHIFHNHHLEYCHSTEDKLEHSCHIKIIFPNTLSKQACLHKTHIREEIKNCEICKFEFIKDIHFNAPLDIQTFISDKRIDKKIICSTFQEKSIYIKGRSPPFEILT